MPTDPTRYAGETTWMGMTLSHDLIADLIAKGLNPWLTAACGSPVPLAADDWRRTATRPA